MRLARGTSDTRGIRLVVLSLLLATFSVEAGASVYIYPNFGEPIAFDDAIISSSPDSKSVIAIDRDGKKLWSRQFKRPVSLQRRDSFSAMVQQGRNVFALDPASGRLEKLIRLPAHEVVSVGIRRGIVVGFDSRFSRRHARFRHPETLATIWEADLIEDIVAANAELLVVKSGRREYESLIWSNSSFQLHDVTLVALDRTTGAVRWTLPLGDSDQGVRGEFIGSYLVIGMGFWNGSLQVLDPRDGSVVRKRELERGAGDMAAVGGRLVYLDRRSGTDENILRTATVPELAEVSSVTIHSRESLVMMQNAPWLVTHGFYSAAAFDPATGKRLWEKERQMFFEPPEGDTIVAAVVEERNARAAIVEIRIPDGTERNLYSEAVKELPEQEASSIGRFEEWMHAAETALSRRLERIKERRRRLPIGDELCFQHLNSGIDGMEDFLVLERDGTYTHVAAEDGVERSRDHGTWERHGTLNSLRAVDEVRDVQSGRLAVLVGHSERVALLEELDISIEALLAMAPLEPDEFFQDALDRAAVRHSGCPPERSSYCTADGFEHMGVMLSPVFDFTDENPWKPVSRADVEGLRVEIRRYLRSADQNLFQFELRTYRSERYPIWCDKQLLWNDDESNVRYEIDGASEGESPPRAQVMAGCNGVRARMRVVLVPAASRNSD